MPLAAADSIGLSSLQLILRNSIVHKAAQMVIGSCFRRPLSAQITALMRVHRKSADLDHLAFKQSPQPVSTAQPSSVIPAKLSPSESSKGPYAQHSAQTSSHVQATLNRFEALIANNLLISILKDLNPRFHEWVSRGPSQNYSTETDIPSFQSQEVFPERLWIQEFDKDTKLREASHWPLTR